MTTKASNALSEKGSPKVSEKYKYRSIVIAGWAYFRCVLFDVQSSSFVQK